LPFGLRGDGLRGDGLSFCGDLNGGLIVSPKVIHKAASYPQSNKCFEQVFECWLFFFEQVFGSFFRDVGDFEPDFEPDFDQILTRF
jgi:hypothetical protein